MLCSSRLRLKPTEPSQARELAEALQLSPVTAQLLLQRGLATPDEARAFLHEGAEAAHDPWTMRDMARAVDLLEEALRQGERVLIHGDYDVDGVSATVLLYESLQELGFQVEYHVPDRFAEGYGVSLGAVEKAAERGAQLLLTADCGSSSRHVVERAHALGMRVIISDHHQLPAHPPEPEAFLNPHLPDCAYPFKELCGTGVAYKLVGALYERLGRPAPVHHLDLVALATIADVVTLRGENRALVRTGLEWLAQTERLGLQTLAQLAAVSLEGEEPLGASCVAFGLGPRINAAGRLATARMAVELLLSQDPAECQRLASQLEAFNQERRAVERAMRLEVEARLDEERLAAGVVVEGDPGWHQGVVGITAARIVERYGMPAFIMAIEGDQAKGSARSPENVDLQAAMGLCADVFVKWGGHARAAGFTVEVSRLEEMRQRLSEAVAQVRQGPAPVRVDLPLSLGQANLDLARELALLEPIGEGNRRPLFLAERVRLEQVKVMGSDGEHLRLFAVQGNARRKAVAFRQAADRELLQPDRLYYDILFQLEQDNWDGLSSASLVIEALLEPAPPLVAWLRGEPFLPPAQQGPHFLDLRHVMARKDYLYRVVEKSPEALLVVSHRGQVPRTLEQIRRDLGCTVRVEPLDELTEAAPDVVLLGPPRDVEGLRHPAFWAAQRVHCLFGDRELELEESRQRSLSLDRGRMESIWKRLSGTARGGRLTPAQLNRVDSNPDVVQLALGVFEELGLASWVDGLLQLGRGAGARLEDSQRFLDMTRRRQKFAHVRRMFQERDLRLQERLRGA